ncbi:copper amine oxidase N-terminal domain-containing protein [Saccharibacillus qingshengii]|uniref:copper amine oxidase N-terminal domain-containing protein n=1 Tax=Saccharibacillus qingshengii TaxID=1763540 RepID=UPI001553522B|nr:copper amine oxidase N-terminal domain-containing protein [Saccharibacillus qingshengii]
MKNKAYKWIVGLLAGSLLISPLLPIEAEAAAQTPPSLSINGGTAQSGELEIRGGRTYIAVQAASERLGFRVDYDRGSKVVTLLRPDTKLSMKLGQAEAEIDGKRVKVGAAAFSANGQVYVPIQALATALKSKSGWKAEAKTVTLNDPGRYAIDSAGGQTA